MELSRLKAARELVSTKGDAFVPGGQGVYTYLFAKLGGARASGSGQTIRLLSSSTSKASSSELATTLVRPTTEGEFFDRLFAWVWVVTALGMTSFVILMHFVREVVFDPQFLYGLTWQQCCELFLVYLKEIENDTTRELHFGNVCNRGKFDTMMTRAKLNAAMFFRIRGANPRLEGASSVVDEDTKWSGKFDNKSTKCCIAFNMGKQHTAKMLDEAGNCRFAHLCMQWVSDKGPGGMCRGNHRKSECTYDKTKKLDKPLP